MQELLRNNAEQIPPGSAANTFTAQHVNLQVLQNK